MVLTLYTADTVLMLTKPIMTATAAIYNVLVIHVQGPVNQFGSKYQGLSVPKHRHILL